MKTTKIKSICGQITWSLFVVCTIVFLLTELVILERTHTALWNSLDHDLTLRTQFLTSLVDIENYEFDFDEEDISQEEYGEETGSSYFMILQADTLEEIARSPSLTNKSDLMDESLKSVDVSEPIHFTRFINGRKYRIAAAKHLIVWDDEDDDEEEENDEDDHVTGNYQGRDVDGDRPEVYGVFVVGVGTDETEKQFTFMFQLTAGAMALGLFLLLWSGRLLLRKNLKHLNDFADEVSGISSKNLKPVHVPDIREIAVVAKTLNEVVAELERVFQRERQFTSNVAHELRTPISEIRSLVEVALDYSDDIDPETRELLEDVMKSNVHLHSILENLLVLSRHDSAQLKTEPSRFNVRDVVLPALKRIRKKAESRGLRIASNVPEECTIFTDEHMFQTVLDNLLANAANYAAEKGEIRLEVKSTESDLELIVTNPVIDLTPEDLPHLFDRFWRKHQVRSTEDSHSGLGLPIAEALLSHLGFSISVDINDQGTFRVLIRGARHRKI